MSVDLVNRVIPEDDQSKADEAVNAVQKLINRDNVCGILGEVASKRRVSIRTHTSPPVPSFARSTLP